MLGHLDVVGMLSTIRTHGKLGAQQPQPRSLNLRDCLRSPTQGRDCIYVVKDTRPVAKRSVQHPFLSIPLTRSPESSADHPHVASHPSQCFGSPHGTSSSTCRNTKSAATMASNRSSSGASSSPSTPCSRSSSDDESRSCASSDVGDVELQGLSFQAACGMVSELRLQYMGRVAFRSHDVGDTQIRSLPLKPASQGSQPVTWVFDIMRGVPCIPLEEHMVHNFDTHDYCSLPEPFSPASHTDIPITMDIVARNTTGSDGAMDVVKQFRCTIGRMPRATAIGLCRGEAMIVDCQGVAPKTTLKAICFMLDRMGGKQVRGSTLVADVVGVGNRIDPNSVDRGYDHIRDNCPKTNEDFERLRWVTKELMNVASPIHGWSRADVMEAVRCMQTSGSLATTQKTCPSHGLTSRHICARY